MKAFKTCEGQRLTQAVVGEEDEAGDEARRHKHLHGRPNNTERARPCSTYRLTEKKMPVLGNASEPSST